MVTVPEVLEFLVRPASNSKGGGCGGGCGDSWLSFLLSTNMVSDSSPGNGQAEEKRASLALAQQH